MNNFVIYSIEIAISLALFYFGYWVFLKNETFFKLNRFYLMFSVIVSLLMPLTNISIGPNSFISSYLTQPIEQYEQSIIGNITYKEMPNEISISENTTNKLSKKEAGAYHPGTTELNSSEAIQLNSIVANSPDKKSNWLTITLVIYFIGFSLFLWPISF
ncbi:MAG: hypothetical protein JWO32_1865 [Bacteroidetes bacterium]|nr:hypothetical protein [Bacteroidota bacterium]